MTPLLGICLGHQAIAAAYGARIAAAPQPVHGQAALITHDGGGLLAGPAPSFPGRALPLPDRRRALLAARPADHRPRPRRNPHGAAPHRASGRGLQFHPESILTPHGDGIIANFARAVVRRRPGCGRRPPASAFTGLLSHLASSVTGEHTSDLSGLFSIITRAGGVLGRGRTMIGDREVDHR